MPRRPKLFNAELDFDAKDYSTPFTVVGLLSYAIHQVSLGFEDALESTIAIIHDGHTEVKW